MNLREYRDGVIAFCEANPDALDLPVISARDDEGNGFTRVGYSPSKGYAEDIGSSSLDDFCQTGDDPERWADEGMEEPAPNAVCIN